MVSFYKVGIALADGMISMGDTMYEVKTLSTFREEFGEENEPISYLKLDVEGWEIEAMEKWADDGRRIEILLFQ